jgi:hypothetical protein
MLYLSCTNLCLVWLEALLAGQRTKLPVLQRCNPPVPCLALLYCRSCCFIECHLRHLLRLRLRLPLLSTGLRGYHTGLHMLHTKPNSLSALFCPFLRSVVLPSLLPSHRPGWPHWLRRKPRTRPRAPPSPFPASHPRKRQQRVVIRMDPRLCAACWRGDCWRAVHCD